MLTPFEIFLVVLGITLFVIFLIWIIGKCSSGSNGTSCDFDFGFPDWGDSSDSSDSSND